MSSSKPPPLNPNPSKPQTSKHVHHIGGIKVEFPYQPYGSQLAFMGRVIATLDRAQKEKHCHALLESPTGTGKSLSLLCSALAWQQNCRGKNLYGSLSQSKPAPEAFVDHLGHGGGFVPEMETSGNQEPATPAMANNKKQKKKMCPTIFYASRTHSQITQLIREYKKTTYRVPMAILASRKHYCTNKHIRGEANIDEQCKLLLKDREKREVGCPEFKNAHKVKSHPSLQRGGCHEAHDIEDLVKIGQIVKGCSYFGAQALAEDARLIFCPYSYLINPVIRRAMDVDIEGAIVIFDEAHNIEDMAREAGSVDVEEDALIQLQTELRQLRETDPMTYQPLCEMTEEILSWMNRRKKTLTKHEFQHHVSSWTGDKVVKELEEANISQQCFPILQECATKAIKASDADQEVAYLSGMSATLLESLFSSLNYFFLGNGIHVSDYLLALRGYIKRDPGNATGSWAYTLSLWCLNPAVVFKGIADISLSVILTSGTLSPMTSFSSELGVSFGTCLEAPHVIDAESQLWAAVISSGPCNYPLNASYRTADTYALQDALGTSLEEICKIVPGGCLVFFPSYKLLEKLSSRWVETGQWSRLNAQKPLYVEPRGGNQDDFEPVLKGYYDSIRFGSKPVIERKRRGKKLGLNSPNSLECKENSRKGAAFLAVCRGKVSEGIDFSDENARVVIIVGIPFPNVTDIQVAQKKKYNDTHKSSKSLLSGNDWYCQQAFRALNQAAGRCIRHRYDYGAVIFLDERFREERNQKYISKWLKKSIKQYDKFDQSLEGLKSFFKDVKEQVGSSIEVLDPDIEHIDTIDQKKGFTGKKNQKVIKSGRCEQKLMSNQTFASKQGAQCQASTFATNHCFSPCRTESQFNGSVLTSKKDPKNRREYIDLECDSKKDPRCSWPQTRAVSPDEPELTIVKETPGMDETAESVYMDEYSSSTIIETSTGFQDQQVSHSTSIVSLVTPTKEITPNTYIRVPETESSLNLSVNSHAQKRMKFFNSPRFNHLKRDLDTPDCLMVDSMTTADASCRDECCRETNDSDNNLFQVPITHCSDNKLNKYNVPRLCTIDKCETSCAPSGHVAEKILQISCFICKNPLGLSENNFHIPCSLTSLSKIHLASLWEGKLESPAVNPPSIPVVVSDVSSIDQRLCSRTAEGAAGQGIWSKEDGCVFNTIFCPFCSNQRNCLGLQVMAADASNIQLLNKMLLYFDRLEIKDLEVSKNKGSPSSSGSCVNESSLVNSIQKFVYSPQQQNSGGWRTTRSKMRLPKKG